MKLGSIGLVIRREYMQAIRKPAFWVSIIILPLFIIGASYISSASTKSAEQKLKQQASKAKSVLVVDEANVINTRILAQTPTLHTMADAGEAETAVRNHQADAAIIYPADIIQTKQLRIIVDQRDASPLSESQFDDLAKILLQQSLLSHLPDVKTGELVIAQPAIQHTTYKQGHVYSFGEDIPYLILLAVYVLILITSTNMFLLSVTEEKENRAIEIVMTAIRPTRLIMGKIIGLSLVALTQVFVLSGLSLAVLLAMHNRLPFHLDLSQVTIQPLGLALGVFYLLSGVLFIAAVMVGIGSMVPTAKEAASLVSVAMIGAIAPIYFITTILQDPTGPVAKFTSYFPLTAPAILQVRHMLEALPGREVAASIVWMLLLVVGGFYASARLFRLGAISYSNRISLRELWRKQS